MAYIKFQRGSLAAYQALGSWDDNTLYFVYPEQGEGHVGRLYLGKNLISGGDVVIDYANLDDLKDVIVKGAGAGDFLVKNEEGNWVPKTAADVAAEVLETLKLHKTLAYDAEGALGIAGFEAAENGAQLMKDSTGALAWIKPDTTTVEGIQGTLGDLTTSVENLDDKVDVVVEDVTALEERASAVEQNLAALEAEVGNPAAGETPASGLYAELEVIESEIDLKANAADVYTKGEADAKFETIENVALKANAADVYSKTDADAKFETIEKVALKADKTYVDDELAKKANAADVYAKGEVDTLVTNAIANAEHLKRILVDELPAVEAADVHAIYMVPKAGGSDPDVRDEFMVVNGAWEKIGDTAVNLDGYATEDFVADAIKNKAEVGASYTKAEADGLLAGKANVGDAYTKAEADNLLNAKANIVDVEALLNGKVDVDENARLMTLAEGEKLAGIAAGAEVNVINAVSEDFTIGENRTLVLNNISASKIVDLESLLNAKADKADVEAIDERVTALEGFMTWTEMKEPTV